MKNDGKILILGSNGMVGSEVNKYLSKKYSVITVSSRINTKEDIIKILNRNSSVFYIINCIGKLKRSHDYSANYLIPKYLDQLAQKYSFKFIQISTDDVFNPLSKSVNEKSIPGPISKYGKSKLKGEIKSPYSLTIRSSFLGYDNRKQKGLINFILKNRDKKLAGYQNQNWSGCTTLQFAKLCEHLLEKDNFNKLRRKSNVIHFAPLGPTNKYNLLQDIAKGLNQKQTINKSYAPETVTRYLDSIVLNNKFYLSYGRNIQKSIKELKEFYSI